MDDLFSASTRERSFQNAPLAVRMRPNSLDEYVGQQKAVGKGSWLRAAIEHDVLSSVILYGPAGTGKTTLAHIIANHTKSEFVEVSAVTGTVKDLRRVIDEAKTRLNTYDRRTILFIDEIHRFSKSQQDALLHAVENRTVIMIGATTENPYFEVNSALLSRAQIYELRGLDDQAVIDLLRRALSDPERGIADPPAVDDDALAMLAARAGGDARSALGALERAATTAGPGGHVDLAAAEDALQKRAVLYDKGGDRHYDYISAWIKATRNSDVDASVYYLAAMLAGGEDPRFIARRMVIFASEDVGNAAPQALAIATAAGQAVDRVGLPECRINLAQAAVYLALAPKSNASYEALLAAEEHVRRNGAAEPPTAIRDGHYPGAKELGRGVGYRYPHDEPGGVSDQRTLPEALGDTRFYEPTDRGFEAELTERLKRLRARRGQGPAE